MKKIKLLMIFSILLIVLNGCGDDSSDAAKPETTVNFSANTNLDGYVSYASGVGYGSDYGNDTMWTGNNGQFNFRSFASFSQSISAGIKINSAVLQVYLVSIQGTPQILGDLQVDHMIYDTFNGTLYSLAALQSNIGTLINTGDTPSAGTFVSLNVTAQVQNDIDNGRSFSQFRLYHTFTSTTGSNYIEWATGEDASNQPRLVVKY